MSKTVLVVEDTELLRRMYSDRLTQDGYRVLLAADGLEALSILRSDTPDLILLDLVMPKMSGLEVLDLLKKDPRLAPIPVIVLSNLGQEADIARGVEMGAVDYLVKNDAKPSDIAAKIAEYVSGRDEPASTGYRLVVQDRVGDVDRFVADHGLIRRLWCPACEVELNLELHSQADKQGWYDAHVICPVCGREY